MGSSFDAFAWFYDRHWAGAFDDWQQPALKRLLFSALNSGARILDLCCGTGTLARQLVAHGYDVVGIDSSMEMVRIARENVPRGRFFQGNATDFAVRMPVDAIVCTFDSLNNLLEADEMQRAFHSVSGALIPGGRFVFDINTGAAYGERWNQTFCEVQPDHAFFLRGGFDAQRRIGYTQVTMFRLLETWQRSDVEIRQRPWDIAEVEPMLRSAGFSEICAYRAGEDLQMPGHYGIGRVYVCARKAA